MLLNKSLASNCPSCDSIFSRSTLLWLQSKRLPQPSVLQAVFWPYNTLMYSVKTASAQYDRTDDLARPV